MSTSFDERRGLSIIKVMGRSRRPVVFTPCWNGYPPRISKFWDALSAPWQDAIQYWVWLFALRLGLVKKGSVPSGEGEYGEYDVYEIDHQDMRELCISQIKEVRSRTGRMPDILLMGDAKFYELDATIGFEIPRAYSLTDGYSLRAFGLRVVIVPWMDGVLPIHSSDININ